MPRGAIMSIVVICVLTGLFALWIGLRSQPLGETAIILRAADIYVAETGGQATHCFARPSPLAGVSLIVTCAPPEGEPWYYPADARGRFVDIDPAIIENDAPT